MNLERELTLEVKRLAGEAGFALVGVAGPDVHLDGKLRRWLDAGCHADMDYLAANVEKRLQPSLLVDDLRSIICLAVSYAPPADRTVGPADAYIASYALGRDYHKVLKKRAHRLCDRLAELRSDFAGRAFVDTAPVAERSLAVAAGLGWVGRNGMLISPELGNTLLLAEIFCNLPLVPDEPHAGDCGQCDACVQACPTGAILPDGLLDCRRCLSYHTIENRSDIPAELWPAMGNCVFGCDTCQSVCPHSRCVPSGDIELLGPADQPNLAIADVLQWSYDDWDAATRGGARRRATYEMYLRNAIIAAGNSNQPELRSLLGPLRQAQPQLAEYLDWADTRLAGGNDI